MNRWLSCFTLCLLLTGTATLAAEPEATVVLTSPKPGIMKNPFGIDFDTRGTMYIVELYGGHAHTWEPDGTFTTIAGNGEKGYAGDGGSAAKAVFNGMHNTAVMPDGTMFIADSFNHRIRKIDAKTGIISTFAGTGTPGFSGDGGPARKATFNNIMCITLTADNGTLLVADLKNRRVRSIDMKTGIVSTLAGNGKKGVPKDGAVALKAPLADPRAVVADSKGQIYIVERSGHALRVVGTDGKIRTVAGTGKKGHNDGDALNARLNGPKHACVDAEDRVYIADDQNALIRLYDPATRQLTTVLGNGAIKLDRPHGVCFEKGTLYVVDSGNHRILKL